MEQSFLLEKELADKVIEITGVDYYGKLGLKDVENVIKDLLYEYHLLEEKLEDQVKHCREFHEEKNVNFYEEYGINRNDYS